MIRKQLDTVLQKEVDRKDFLKHVGIAAAAIVGVPTLLKVVGQGSLTPGRSSAAGYGASAYGGVKASR